MKNIDYNETARRLRKALSDANLTAIELSRKSGVSKSSISQFMGARGRPSSDAAEKLATVLGVSTPYLLGYDVPERDISGIANLSKVPARPIPILGEICAGNGIDCRENYSGVFFLDASIKGDYCLEVRGNSMTGAHIFDGDLAMIRRTFSFRRGQIYAVLLKGENTASLKRVYEQADSLVLMPCNPEYEPTICRKDDALLIGELVGSFHKAENGTSQKPVPSGK